MARSKGRTGRPWQRLRRQVIAASDVCWLCGQGVDKDLRWPHPMSASVDHRIPLSRGGPPRDLANLALAHLRCNIGKKDRMRPKPRQPAAPAASRW